MISKVVLFLLFPFALYASDPGPKEMQEFYKSLKCLVCNGQSVYESNSEFSEDIQAKTNQLLDQGKNLDQVRGYLVASYGDELLIEQKVSLKTLPLWALPYLLLAMFGIKWMRRGDGKTKN